MPYEPRQEWPMGSYKNTWRLFRRMSNENDVTAEHLISRSHWPRVKNLALLDIGCGDGLLTERIVLRSKKPVAEVRLLDPDKDFLGEAKAHITETGVVTNVKCRQGLAEDNLPECCRGVHAILAVHVVYLMRNGAFKRLIDFLPKGIPLYVVLDTPDSVFSKLWKKTAKKYASRSAKVHEALSDLPADQFEINFSTITSYLDSPLHQEQPGIKESVLSLLCYAEMQSLPTTTRRWVQQQVRDYTVGDHVHCESACYEIVKL